MSVPEGRLTFKCKMLDGSDGQFQFEDCGESQDCYPVGYPIGTGEPFMGWTTWIKVGDVEDYSVVESARGIVVRQTADRDLLRHYGVDTGSVDWGHPL